MRDSLIGQQIVVYLKGGDIVDGIVNKADNYQNLILHDVSIKQQNGKSKNCEEIQIKGISIRSIKLPIDIIEQHKANLERKKDKDYYDVDGERQRSKSRDKSIIEEKVFEDASTNERPGIGRGRGYGRGRGITQEIPNEEQLPSESRVRAFGRGQRTTTFDYEEAEVKIEEERKPAAFGRGSRGRGVELQDDSLVIEVNPVGGRGKAYGRGQQNKNDRSGLDVIDELIFIGQKLNKISQRVANSDRGTLSYAGRSICSKQNQSQVKDQESASSKLLGYDNEIFEDIDQSQDKENQAQHLDQSKDAIIKLNSEIQELSINDIVK